jgi:hypothetical protein
LDRHSVALNRIASSAKLSRPFPRATAVTAAPEPGSPHVAFAPEPAIALPAAPTPPGKGRGSAGSPDSWGSFEAGALDVLPRHVLPRQWSGGKPAADLGASRSSSRDRSSRGRSSRDRGGAPAQALPRGESGADTPPRAAPLLAVSVPDRSPGEAAFAALALAPLPSPAPPPELSANAPRAFGARGRMLSVEQLLGDETPAHAALEASRTPEVRGCSDTVKLFALLRLVLLPLEVVRRCC